MSTKGRTPRASVTAISTALLAGCCTTDPPTMDVPVIDVHAHLFNARDLPIAGIVDAILGQKGLTIPGFAAGIADILHRWTPREEPLIGLAAADDEPEEEEQELTEGERDMLVSFLARPSAGVALASEDAEEGGEVAERPVRGAEEAASLDDEELVAATLHDLRLLADPEEELEGSGICRLVGALRFLRVATSGHQQGVDRMTRTFGGQPALYVHHLMDLAKTYDDRPPLAFEQQLDVFRALAEDNPRLLTFVAFDPFRGDEALELVKAAHANGAIGVKFYPPSGYRPAGNAITPPPPHPVLAAQWDSRYLGLGDELSEINAQLDELAEKLFDYCEDKGLAIFTHCTDEGFEAEEGYGRHHADPEFWVRVLDEHPELRVAFGHAGGYENWNQAGSWTPRPKNPGAGAAKTFEQKVYELCVSYPNAYADFGFHGFDGPEASAALKRAFITLFSRDDQTDHDFADKVIYGTDWYMVAKQTDPVHAMKEFHEMFRGELANHRRAFFAGNAVNYLALREHAAKGTFSGERLAIVNEVIAQSSRDAD